MRRQIAPGPFGLVFGFSFLAFLGFFCYSQLVFPPRGLELLERFRWPFVWSNSFRLFVDWLLPVTMAAVALSYALGPAREAGWRPARGAGRAAVSFGQLVSGHLSFLIALAVLYSFLFLGVYPEIQANLNDFASLSREAKLYLDRAQEADKEGRHAEAALDYERYLAIDPDNRQVVERLGQLPAARPVAAPAVQPEPPATRYAVLTKGKQGFELLQMAEDFFEREDYVSAHYYATLAVRLEPSRADAVRLAARSWQEIGGTDLTRKDQEQRELFLAKREGFRLVAAEEYVRAFYHFRALQARYPRDPELATWVERSREGLVLQTFFLDEARKIDALPGREQLLLRNDGGGYELTEILSVGKMVNTEDGTFFKDVEVLRFGPGGQEQHFAAPYGRLTDLRPEAAAAGRPLVGKQAAGAPGSAWAVILHGVERTTREGPALPRRLSGGSRSGPPPTVLELRAGPHQLPALAVGETTAASVGFLQLWQMRSRVREYGHPEHAVAAEILRRLLHPFSFLVLSLAAAAFGWSARPRSLSGRPALVGYLFVPLFPLVGLFVSALYLHAQRVLMNFLLLQLGFAACLPAFLVLQGVLLFAALVLLAGQPGE